MNRAAAKTFGDAASHVVLNNIPKNATTTDIWRVLKLNQIRGVKEVRLLYKRFRPTGRAVLACSVPDHTQDVVRECSKTSIGLRSIKAYPTTDEQYFERRKRGLVGKSEATQRGALTGNGPTPGGNPNRTVTVTNVPHGMHFKKMAALAEGFELKGDDGTRREVEKWSILKVPPPLGIKTLYSRYLYYFKTSGEAERFVRKHHLTEFNGQVIRAEVMY